MLHTFSLNLVKAEKSLSDRHHVTTSVPEGVHTKGQHRPLHFSTPPAFREPVAIEAARDAGFSSSDKTVQPTALKDRLKFKPSME